MKKFLYLAFACCIIAACNNNKNGTNEFGGSAKESKNVSARDRSINPSNSYSNLFFDSTQLEKFISEKKISDSIARRMRSFYNDRNYQWAWFSGDGLTEQARGFWNLHDYATTYEDDSALKDKKLQKRMDNLIAEEDLSVSSTDKNFLNTELTLTQHFITYMLQNYEK